MAKFEIKYFIIGIIIANQKVDRSPPHTGQKFKICSHSKVSKNSKTW